MNSFKILHGIDVVNISRDEFKQKSFAQRIMTSHEFNFYNDISTNEQKTVFLASIFACKEAVMKAYNLSYGYKEICIKKTSSSRQLYINDQLQENVVVSVSYVDNLIFVSVFGLNIDINKNQDRN